MSDLRVVEATKFTDCDPDGVDENRIGKFEKRLANSGRTTRTNRQDNPLSGPVRNSNIFSVAPSGATVRKEREVSVR